MPLEIIKPAILAFVYFILFMLERFIPYFQPRQKAVSHSLRNLGLAAINSVVTVILFITILQFVYHWTSSNQIGLLYQLDIPSTYSFFLAFLLIDLWQYLWHRLNHQIPLLWKFHQVHHADKDMDASTALRFHPIEIAYSSLIRAGVFPVMGIQLEHLIIYELIMLPIILWHHSNIRINEFADTLLRIIIVTPHMHRLHHSDIHSETDSNYASVFSFWDRLFRSYTMRSIAHGFNLGLGNKFSIHQWNRLRGMLTIPFLGKSG